MPVSRWFLARLLVRVTILPALEIILGDVRALFFLGVTFPGLISLLYGTFVGPLARIVLRRFFAHRSVLTVSELKKGPMVRSH
jgi:hypothetical protein